MRVEHFMIVDTDKTLNNSGVGKIIGITNFKELPLSEKEGEEILEEYQEKVDWDNVEHEDILGEITVSNGKVEIIEWYKEQ